MTQKMFVVFAIALMCMPVVALGQTSRCGMPNQPPCSEIGRAPTNPGSIGRESGTNTGVPFTTGTVVDAILILVNWFSWLIGVAAVVMGLYAGFLFITGGDDSGKIETARKILMWAIIGIAVAIFAFGIVSITTALFGIV